MTTGTSGGNADRIWNAIRAHDPIQTRSAEMPVEALAGQVALTVPTVRGYLKEWLHAGYVGHLGDDKSVVRLLAGHTRAPRIQHHNKVKGSVFVYHPDEDTYAVLDYRAGGRGRRPIVTRYRRGPLQEDGDRLSEAEMGVTGPLPAPIDAPVSAARTVAEMRGFTGPSSAAPAAGEVLPAPAPETLPVPADAPTTGEALPVPMSWSPPPEVHDAAARICSLFDTALALSAAIEAQMMEALHEIRRATPDEETFRAVVAEMTPLRPADAARMVETWDVARRQRDLRELAQNRPREAMSLVRAFADAGAGDAEVTAVLALPPRKRNARIREMVRREQDGAGGHHPADREAIRALTEERDALAGQVEALSNPPAAHPGQRWRSVVERVRQAEAVVADAAGEVVELCAAPADAPPAQTTPLLSLTDSLQASLDTLSGALLQRDG